ncbi:hypothetical protein ACFLZM_04365 [Thermodesulfobacteriota bacterium]
MNITRMYTDDKGETHFENTEEKGVDHRDLAHFSRVIEAKGIVFRDTDPLPSGSSVGEWHNAPRRQYILYLSGKTEIEVSDGERRVFKTGDILLVEDTTGKGHRNRTIDDQPKRTAFVRLE